MQSTLMATTHNMANDKQSFAHPWRLRNCHEGIAAEAAATSLFQEEITLRAEGIAAEAAATTGLALKTGYNEDAAMKGTQPMPRHFVRQSYSRSRSFIPERFAAEAAAATTRRAS